MTALSPQPHVSPDLGADLLRERPALETWLTRAPVYEAYTYGYPHKTSYRHFEAPRPLQDIWQNEDQSALFLYVHVPFCEMRCGFCNLFTRTGGDRDLTEAYVAALERQARAVREALDSPRAARLAFGGGTPTFLDPAQLGHLFDVVEDLFGASAQALPTSLECSPETISGAHLEAALARGVDRISVGIQSFFDDELRALGRPLRGDAGRHAVERMRAANPKILNLDLIYGIDGQTVDSWLASLQTALQWRPEELFLYPLYVRPLTGLGRRARSWDDHRLELYRAGRDLLTAEGYTQCSTRLFRSPDAPDLEGPVYTCQEDGMVGLGCGARSYTRGLHYSDDWAVSPQQVKAILGDWVTRSQDDFRFARYGVRLDAHEQKTRYVLKSVLQRGGLDASAYEQRFDTTPASDWPELDQLVQHGLLETTETGWRPTSFGLERGDQFGPWLYSSAVRRAMQAFEIR